MKTNKKKILEILENVLIFVAVVLIVGNKISEYKSKKEVKFDENAKYYFDIFIDRYEQDEYEIYSFDAYYLEDVKEWYFHVRYTYYSSEGNEWCKIDEVAHFTPGINIECKAVIVDEYEEVNNELTNVQGFQRAKKAGKHKSYTDEDIEKLLKDAYNKRGR